MGPSPGYGAIGFWEQSKCGQLSMGSNDGMHLIFPIPYFSASGEVGRQLPATGLKQGKTKLTLFASWLV
jgi:hypothetical protein